MKKKKQLIIIKDKKNEHKYLGSAATFSILPLLTHDVEGFPPLAEENS